VVEVPALGGVELKCRVVGRASKSSQVEVPALGGVELKQHDHRIVEPVFVLTPGKSDPF
jgi:hypothetical protein